MRSRARCMPRAVFALAGWALAVSGVLAAPVLSSGDADAGAAGADAAVVPNLTQPPPLAAPRAIGTVAPPEASTGNKNLDLLLELHGRPGDEPQRASAPRSAAAASAAAAALAELRAKAAQRPAPDSGMNKPPVQPFEGIGTLEGDAQSAAPPERREWTGRPATSGGGGFGGGGGYGDGGRSSGASHGAYDESPLLRLPRVVMEFLRENRYWLLGALGVLAVIGSALKAYSRRI